MKTPQKMEAPKITFRHFWVYALVLFALALTLILLAGFYQNVSLKTLESQYSTALGTINQNNSVLNNIQELCDRLKAQNESLLSENEEIIAENEFYSYEYWSSLKDRSDLKIISDSLCLYLSGRYGDARKKLTLINEASLSQEAQNAYNNAKELIK